MGSHLRPKLKNCSEFKKLTITGNELTLAILEKFFIQMIVSLSNVKDYY
jgi:hypothetical protein